jgi:hypothetical protein
MLFSLLIIALFFQPQFASAEEITATTNITDDLAHITYTCTPAAGQYTQALINCFNWPIRNAVLRPVTGLLVKVSDFSRFFLSAVVTLSIALLGIRIMGGEKNVIPQSMSFLIRLGIAAGYTYNLGGLGGRFFSMFDEVSMWGMPPPPACPPLPALCPPPPTPWLMFDTFISDLLGFMTTDPSSINNGIIALLSGSFFAQNMGALLTIIGLFTIFVLLSAIFQAMYLYLSSMLAIAFLIVIAPLFVPFLVFNYTERFLMIWFNLYISAILTPLIMFTIVGLFLDSPVAVGPPAPGIFRVAVNNIFSDLGGTDYVRRCLYLNQPITDSWMLPTNSSLADELKCKGTGLAACPERDRITSATQLFINPLLYQSLNYSPLSVPKIDCGVDDAEIKKNVLFSMFKLLIYSVLLYFILSKIPEISHGLSNGATIGLSNLTDNISSRMNVQGHLFKRSS